MKTLEGKWIYLVVTAILGILATQSLFFIIPLLLLFIVIFFHSKELAILFFIISICITIESAWIVHRTSNLKIDDNQYEFIGKMITIPKIDGNQVMFTIKDDHLGRMNVVKTIKTENEKRIIERTLKVGMTCDIHGELHRPISTGNIHQFDYRQFLQNRGIYYVVDAQSLRCQAVQLSLLDHIRQLRQKGIQFINRVYPDEVKGVVNALVFGDRQSLSPEIIEAYQSLGLMHLLAISGLHVGVLTSIVFYFLIRLGITRETSLIVIFVLIPLYMIITGLSPSIVRAGLMIILFLTNQLLKKHPPPLDVLSWSLLILLIYNPQFLFDIGFQLSYIVTFSLFFSYPLILNRFSLYWQQLLATSSIALISTLPILLYNFYSFSLAGLFLNLVFIPLITLLIFPLSLLSLFLMLTMPTIGSFLIIIMTYMVTIPHHMLLWLNSFSAIAINIGRPTLLIEITLIIGLITAYVLFELIENRIKRYSMSLGIIILILIIHALNPYISPKGKVTFLDVGQGDAILIELPYRQGVYLIDTGGILPFNIPKWKQKKVPYRVGKDVILKELKAKGIRHIDRMILTHRDYDHIGGLKDLIGKINIKEIDISEFFQPTPHEVILFHEATKNGIIIKRVKVGEYWRTGQNSFYILSPNNNSKKSNDRSIVVYALMGGNRWLFTGDLEKEGEQHLLKLYPALRVDILKVGHHGSQSSTSENFLKAIHAKVAVISVGANNRYGHPSSLTLQRLKSHHVAIFRTDQLGAIEVDYYNSSKVIQMLFGNKKQSK